VKIKSVLIALGIATCVTVTVSAADLPRFFKETLPEYAAGDMLKGWGVVQGEGAALDKKTRELVALAVSAQIPCEYCIYAHTEKLKKLGASTSEIREAVATAGYIRLWSTMLHGGGYDVEKFKAEYDQLLSGS